MTNAILLMLLTGLVWTVVGILFGRAPAEKDRLCTFFALNGIIFMAFVYLARPPEAAPAGEILRLSCVIVPSAILEVGCFLLLKLAMDRGSQGIAWCIAQSAMVVAFLGSIVFLDNPSSPWQWLGMALMLGSLVLFGRDKRADGNAVNDARYFRLAFGAFVMNGVAQVLRLSPGYMGLAPETLTWRLPLQAPVGMVFWIWVCLSRGSWRPGAVWRHSVPYGLVVAIGQVCFYLATDAADRIRITSVVMPVAIGTCILLFTLWCRFVRGERLSRGGWTAVALNVAGIALLSSKP